MQNTDFRIIGLTPENIAEYGVCGYKDAKKHLELRRKIEWITPFAFGTVCIINDGKILCHHPISNTMFENIIIQLK